MKTSFKQSFGRIALAVSMLLGAATANAGLVGVKTIEISNAINTWLQVAEVQAYNMSAVDVALASNGAIASAPDWYSSFSTPAKAIDGNTLGNYANHNIFHEGTNNSHDTLTITLAEIVELNLFQIWGRTDGCCSKRDVYDVVFKDDKGSVLFTADNLDASGSSHTANVSFAAAEIPEPGSIALIGLALAGLGYMRKKKSI